ncbi:potassium/sodium hyperpolarization-activated cyclic nucleotide-gated channel 1-like isoform X2 [Cydia pomonella]|uniref:potassium/sodium hyperpolarization-activated cyclic nucleotide-gated channel 1-like isoform X2 n=1 Tax=Cydia pomonella TaxID=82600 RepID=UPI002ADDF62C|nr:potassium/sodium hyperpolarization-activated cyclic nucleotide-gated channel 1-like isoform X2 [Cydia pomonella]
MFRNENIVQRGLFKSVPIENDVINLCVREGGVYGQFRRWWYDLFLLSYNANRSKRYYMSSYAMMMARAAQFHNERRCIHPFSKFRNFWDCLTLHLLLIRMIIFHFNSSVIHDTHIFFHYLLVIIDVVFIVDLYVNAKTGYVVQRTRQVVMNSHDILLNYLSTKVFIHALAAIPLQSLMLLRLGKDIINASSRANLFTCTLKLLSVIYVPRLFQASKYWAKDRGTFAKTVAFKFIRITVVGLVVTYEIITLTNAYNVILGIVTGSIKINTFNGHLILIKYHSEPGQLKNDSIFYFMRLSRLCKIFFLFGFGLLPNAEPADRISAIVSYWVAWIFHLWAGIVLYNCVARENSLNDRLYVARTQTFNVLHIRGLPDTIHDKVVKYYDYKMSSLNILEKKNCLFKALPSGLTSEIKMSCYEKYVVKIPCFSEWPPEVIAKIVDLLQPEIYLGNDLVSSTQNSHEGLVIVEVGLLAVYSRQTETGHLMDGDYFGETALVSDRETQSKTVVAITASTVGVLLFFTFSI